MATFRGRLDFCSNFYICNINTQYGVFPSTENAFAWAKCSDESRLKEFQACTPSQSKRIGKTVKMRPDWEEIKVEVMRRLLKIKFSIPELKEKLLATGNEILVEGNEWHDNFWGSCTCDRCGYRGKNTLGMLLMEVRAQLQQEGK